MVVPLTAAIDLRNPTWPIAVIREALALHARGEAPQPDEIADEIEGQAPATVAGRASAMFVDHQVQLVWRIAWLADAIVGERSRQILSLEIALVLAAATGRWPQFDALSEARARLVTDREWPDARLNALLAAQLPAVGKAAADARLGDHDTLLDTPFHHAILHGDLRLVERLAFELFTGRLSRARAAEHLARARVERLSYVEAVIGLVWADGKLVRAERRLVSALVKWPGFSAAERRLLRGHLTAGEIDPLHIAVDINDEVDRRHLLRTLMIAALIDGDYSAQERAWIEALAAAFGLDGGDVQRLHHETERLLRKQTRIQRGLTTSGRIHRSLRITHGQVEASIARNLGAVVAEVRETGDLMALLAKSTRETLTNEESARMRAQLVDICRTVPALAVFAAPGGAVMLPILARVLPFSLFPSSFRHEDEAL